MSNPNAAIARPLFEPLFDTLIKMGADRTPVEGMACGAGNINVHMMFGVTQNPDTITAVTTHFVGSGVTNVIACLGFASDQDFAAGTAVNTNTTDVHAPAGDRFTQALAGTSVRRNTSPQALQLLLRVATNFDAFAQYED